MFVKSVLTLTDSLTDSLTASLLERPVTLKISCAGIKDKKEIKKERKNIRCYLAQGDACFPNRFYQPRQLTYFIRLVYDILHTIIALIKHILLLIVLHFCFVFSFTICQPFQKFVLVVKKIADNELYVFPLVVRFI